MKSDSKSDADRELKECDIYVRAKFRNVLKI